MKIDHIRRSLNLIYCYQSNQRLRIITWQYFFDRQSADNHVKINSEDIKLKIEVYCYINYMSTSKQNEKYGALRNTTQYYYYNYGLRAYFMKTPYSNVLSPSVTYDIANMCFTVPFCVATFDY